MSDLHPIAQLQMMTAGYYVARSLQVAAELGIADLIGDAPVKAETLAEATGSSPDALSRVLTLLCAQGVFTRVNGSFAHSEVSRFLRSDHPASMRDFARMFGFPVMWEAAIRLDESVTKTGAARPEEFWEYLKKHPASSAVFNATMAAKSRAIVTMVTPAYDFTPYARIADLGGGRGHLINAILQAVPSASGVLFDQPHVVKEAAAIASDRLELQGGDFFRDALPKADAYVVMEVIHDWDDAHSEQILTSIRRSARPGGKVLLVEAMMPDPPETCFTATLDIVMLNLLGGKQRSLAEYTVLLERSGFTQVREVPVGMGFSIIEGTAS